MTRQLAALFIAAFALLLLSVPAPAQQAEDLGEHRVHYNAMNTNVLPPEVASAYSIQRSGRRALLNIAVLRKADNADSMDTPVQANVSARAVNLTGQPRNIEMSQVQEGGAIYYIGTFRIHDQETLTFTIGVQPEGSKQPPQQFSFQQQFYTEE